MSGSTDSGLSNGAQPRRGFALPLAILALALVTAAVAASSAATRAEAVANQSVRAQDRAYQLAEAGLQQFMARRSEAFWCNHCVGDPSTSQYKVDSTETTRVSLTGGYADVVSVRVRPKVLNDSVAIFFIRSRGVDTTIKLSGTGLTVYAERTVGQYATFRTATIKPVAALVTLNGLTRGSSTSISGIDECATFGVCVCVGSQPAVAGVAIPAGATEYQAAFGTPLPTGSTSGVPGTLSADALKATLGIDWNAIINNNAIPATDTIPGMPWPGSAQWRVIRVKTSPYTIPSDGNGILIAEGDINFPGTRDFDGIILVGGKIMGAGSQPSSGLALTGLNYLLPGAGTPPAVSTDNTSMSNTKSFRYNSCYVSQAMALLTTYYAWSNTWLDNLAAW